MVEHCYEGGSKMVVDRYHSGNNLDTMPVLCQYCNVYWEATVAVRDPPTPVDQILFAKHVICMVPEYM